MQSALAVTAKKYCSLNTDTGLILKSQLITNNRSVVKCPHQRNDLSRRRTSCHCNVRKLHTGDVIPNKNTHYLSVHLLREQLLINSQRA